MEGSFGRIGVVAVIVTAMVFPATMAVDAEAHTPIPSTLTVLDPCLNGWQVYDQSFSVPLVADRTWAVSLYVGLNGGDKIQYAYWALQLKDSALPVGTDSANYRDAADDWIKTDLWVFSDTLTAHIGGEMTVRIVPKNYDPAYQCFLLTFMSVDW
jgi:hypothetical protein